MLSTNVLMNSSSLSSSSSAWMHIYIVRSGWPKLTSTFSLSLQRRWRAHKNQVTDRLPIEYFSCRISTIDNRICVRFCIWNNGMIIIALGMPGTSSQQHHQQQFRSLTCVYRGRKEVAKDDAWEQQTNTCLHTSITPSYWPILHFIVPAVYYRHLHPSHLNCGSVPSSCNGFYLVSEHRKKRALIIRIKLHLNHASITYRNDSIIHNQSRVLQSLGKRFQKEYRHHLGTHGYFYLGQQIKSIQSLSIVVQRVFKSYSNKWLAFNISRIMNRVGFCRSK